MKALFLCMFLTPVLLSGQESISLRKVFKEGDRERFSTKLSLTVAFGDVDISLKTEQRVKKVYENGDAELESELLELKTVVNGQPMENQQQPAVKTVTNRVNRFGMPLESGERAGFGFTFLQFVGLVGDKPLTVGTQTVIDWTDPKNSKKHASGKVTLESVTDGIAKLTSNWEIQTPNSEKPLKIDMVSFLEVATGKLTRASGTILGAQSKDVEVKAIQFSMERVNSTALG
jgi:hypothetical protein